MTTATHPCSMRALALYFLRLGAIGFGGPIALVGYMQRDLVDDRAWFTKEEYDEGLALAQLAPGPLAAQLAIYLGWARRGFAGASLVAIAFILPSFVMVLAISALYHRYGGLPWMQGAFYGVGAAVIAIIARSAVALLRKTLTKDWVLWAIALVNAVTTVVTESEIVWLVIGGGVVLSIARARSHPLAAFAPLPAVLLTGVTGAPIQRPRDRAVLPARRSSSWSARDSAGRRSPAFTGAIRGGRRSGRRPCCRR